MNLVLMHLWTFCVVITDPCYCWNPDDDQRLLHSRHLNKTNYSTFTARKSYLLILPDRVHSPKNKSRRYVSTGTSHGRDHAPKYRSRRYDPNTLADANEGWGVGYERVTTEAPAERPKEYVDITDAPDLEERKTRWTKAQTKITVICCCIVLSLVLICCGCCKCCRLAGSMPIENLGEVLDYADKYMPGMTVDRDPKTGKRQCHYHSLTDLEKEAMQDIKDHTRQKFIEQGLFGGGGGPKIGGGGLGKGMGRGFGKGIGKGMGKGMAKGFGKGLGKGMTKGMGKSMAKGVGGGMAKGTGKGVAKGAGKGFGKGAGKRMAQRPGKGAGRGPGGKPRKPSKPDLDMDFQDVSDTVLDMYQLADDEEQDRY